MNCLVTGRSLGVEKVTTQVPVPEVFFMVASKFTCPFDSSRRVMVATKPVSTGILLLVSSVVGGGVSVFGLGLLFLGEGWAVRAFIIGPL